MRFLTPFCYICLKNSNNLKKIESLDTDDIYIRDKLNFCVFMQEKSYYKIPLYICQKCHKKLNIAFYFREMGLKSNDILNEYFTSNRLRTNQLKTKETDNNNTSDKYNNELIATSSSTSSTSSTSSSTTNNLDTNHFDNIIKSNKDFNQPIIEIKQEIIDIDIDKTLIQNKDVLIQSIFLEKKIQNSMKTKVDETLDTNTVIFENSVENDIGNNLIKDLESVTCAENPTNINFSVISSFQKVERELELMFTESTENINQINIEHTNQHNNQFNMEYINQTNTEYINQKNTEYINQRNTENINQINMEHTNHFNMEYSNQSNMENINQLNREHVNQLNREHVNQLNTKYVNQSNIENGKQLKTEKAIENLNGLIDISDEEFFDDSEISDKIPQNNLRCDVCSVFFDNETSLIWHLQIHENLLAFKQSQNNY